MLSEKEKPQEKKEIDLSPKTVMKTLLSLQIFPMLGALFHPAYHYVNVIILGQSERSVDFLAIYGLSTLLSSLLLASVVISVNNALSTLVS